MSNKMERKGFLRKLRNELTKAGVGSDKIDAALNQVKEEDTCLKSMPRKVKMRILKLMPQVGDRVIVVRGKKGFKVFTPQGRRNAVDGAAKARAIRLEKLKKKKNT